ncbi:MAG: ABC transporter ATP-binding protein [Alphaproteobacteria bacterium]|nr:ABC transporter ATP-binding protein [Alphaproteobacteria bacterium]
MERPVTTAPLLMTRALTKTFRGLVALRDHSIVVEPGEIVGVIGPNGSGKSTMFNCVTAFTRPTSGAIEFQGRSLVGKSPTAIAELGIARTFQGSRLFTSLSVFDNVAAAAGLRHGVNLLDAVLGTPRLHRQAAAVRAFAEELIDLVGLMPQRDRTAGDLPYGDQRRLEIARALGTKPRLLMLDEPAAGLNSSETAALLQLIRTIRDRYQVAVIVVEHDMDLIMNLCERIQVLATGSVIGEGTPAEVQASPVVREAYLGHA